MRNRAQWIQHGGSAIKGGRLVQSAYGQVNHTGGHQNPGVAWVERKRLMDVVDSREPVPVVNRVNQGQLCQRYGRFRVEPEYAFPRHACPLEALTGRRVTPLGRVCMDEGKRLSRAYRCRVDPQSLLKITCCALKPDLVEAVQCLPSALIKLVTERAVEDRARWQISADRHLQRAYEASCDLLLNFEHLVEGLII